MKTRSVAIIYGWAEGSAHGKQLRKALRNAGFTITRRSSKADVIIAHSGGVFLLPTNLSASTVMLVGLPYWPAKHVTKSLAQKLYLEPKEGMKFSYWLKKSLLNLVYMGKLRHQYRIKRGHSSRRYPKSPITSSFIAIRNQHDPFMHPEETIQLANEMSWSLLSLQGTHDNLWRQPGQYVAILKKCQADNDQSGEH